LTDPRKRPPPEDLALEPVKVVYVLGAARSGTSLLTSLLGELDGVFAAAEMRLLWRGYDSRRCGCGSSVTDCPVWSKAAVEARAGSGLDEPEEFSRLQLRTTRNRHLPKLLAGARSPDAALYLNVMETMYRTLAEATGSRVIVDSSKSAGEAVLLLGGETTAYAVHVVRDPRAVAYSWERAGRVKAKNRKSTLEAAAAWTASNLAAELALRKYPSERRTRIRYEDYVAEPERALTEVAALTGIDPGNLAFLRGGLPRASRHMVGGNALRFEDQVVTLKPDTEWVQRVSPARSTLIVGVTLPLFVRYGYRMRPPATPSVAPIPPAAGS
jgi:hypothetical protein